MKTSEGIHLFPQLQRIDFLNNIYHAIDCMRKMQKEIAIELIIGENLINYTQNNNTNNNNSNNNNNNNNNKKKKLLRYLSIVCDTYSINFS
jgi:hypothetical protein